MTENETQARQNFLPGWRTTILTLVLLPLMVSLGFWQLDRAEEKRHIQKAVEGQQSRPPLRLEQVDAFELSQLHYRKVRISGRWQPEVFLLDNQVQNAKVGYHVISLFKLDNGSFVLVNRGWMPMNPDRNQLPEIPMIADGEATGDIYVNEDLIKDAPIYAESGWPRRVQRLHLPGLSRELGMSILPLVIRLQQDSPGALQVQWSPINMLPEKHEAYAIQWFAMSVALIVFYLFLGFRKDNR